MMNDPHSSPTPPAVRSSPSSASSAGRSQGALPDQEGTFQTCFSPEELRAILIEFQPIIRRMAGAMVAKNPMSLDIEDLTSAGTMGLLAALRRFDPTREIKFRTFAEYRIRGMMLDEIRAMDWVPRSVRSRQDQVRHAVNEYLQRTGTNPTTKELAQALGVDAEELEGMAGCDPRLVSLDEPVGNDEEGCTLGDVIPDAEEQNPFWECANGELKAALEAALVTLSPRQQKVLHLYYHVGLTMKEIGTHLGLTESGVCRVHAGAIRDLRIELQSIEGGSSQPTRPKNRRRNPTDSHTIPPGSY